MTTAVEFHATVPLRPGLAIAEQILAAARARRVLDCRAGDARSIISADDVRRACLSTHEDVDPYGLRIANAAIAGTLDLRAAAVAGPLHFAACTFARAPQLDGADLHELSITDGRHGGTAVAGVLGSSRLPGLLANGIRIRRDLQLSGTVVTGAHATSASLSRTSAIWLTEARIGGRLLAVGTRIEASGDRAMQCDRTRVAGDVRLIHGFTANREIRLLAADLGGSLDLRAARLSAPDGRALDAAEATIRGSLFILEDPESAARPVIRGRVEMSRASVHGRFLVRNADLYAPPAGSGLHHYNLEEPLARTFLLAPGLTVLGEFVIEGQTTVLGALRLSDTELRGGLQIGRNTQLCTDDETAIDLSHARLGSALRMPGTQVCGTVNLEHARVAGRIDLSGMRVSSPARRRCIVGVGVVAGDVYLRRVRVTGGSVNFRAATLSGNLDAEDAQLSNPIGSTLSLKQARVAGNVRLCGTFSSVGLVMLSRAVIEGRLRCDGATLAWPANGGAAAEAPDDEREPNVLGSAFEAISAVVRSGIGLGWTIKSGGVDFTDARTSYLADDPGSNWPAQSHLTGFTYERFGPLDMKSGREVRDARARRAWLEKLPYDPQPWEQAASVLRANGDKTGAEEILIAQQRRARKERIGLRDRPLRYVWDAMKDRFVGYGYRPHRALFVLLGLIAAVSVVLMLPGPRSSMTAAQPLNVVTADASVGRTPQDHCVGGRVRCFEPVLYAIDTVVPLIDLGQRSAWYPSGPGGRLMGWGLNLCTGIGWFFSTIAALTFARLGRSS